MTPSLTAEQRDELVRKLYLTEPARVVSERTGLSENQVYKTVQRLGLYRNRAQRDAAADLDRAILTLAAQPDGMRNLDVMRVCPKASTSAISAHIIKLREAGMLHSVTVSFRHVRNFSSLSAARIYEQKHAPKMVPLTIGRSYARGPAHLPGDPVITSRTKITIAPTPARALRTNTHAVAG